MTPPLRILELRSVVGSGGGPEKTILLGTARTDGDEFAITVCYIRDLRDPGHDLADRAAALGVDYVEVTERHSFDWCIWPALKTLCRERGIELVHAHEYKSDLLALLLSRGLGIHALATVHGWTGHSWRERRVYYPADKWLLARYEHVIAVSEEIRDELIRTGTAPSRITVVPNGIDASRFIRDDRLSPVVRQELAVEPTDFVVGAVGRLEPQKRFDLLIDAVSTLRNQFPQMRLLIAGSGSLETQLRQQIARLGVGGTCRLLGHERDIPRLHHAFDLFVQSSDYEGTPNAVLEAMAMSTPVVATAAGGTAQLIDDGIEGLVVSCGSVAILANAIGRALDDAALRRRLAKAARARVEGPLSFEARMRAVEGVYREMFRASRETARA